MKLLKLLATAALALHTLSGSAQDFPKAVVKIIVPFPAGAAADNAMRVVTKRLADLWGKPIIVENRAGVPGIQAAALAPADGYTLLMGANSTIVTGPLMRAKLPYEPERDFTPVGRLLTITPVLTVSPNINVRSMKDLIALAKSKPGALNYSSSGIGAPNHLAMEMFESNTGVQLTDVPYKGAAGSVMELLGGEIQVGLNAIPSVLPYIQSGKLIALGVASAKRAEALPNVPTMKEAGVPGFEYTIWYGLFAPAKTPQAIVAKISADLERVLTDPAIARQLQLQGTEVDPARQDEFRRYISADRARWAKLVADRKLKIDE